VPPTARLDKPLVGGAFGLGGFRFWPFAAAQQELRAGEQDERDRQHDSADRISAVMLADEAASATASWAQADELPAVLDGRSRPEADIPSGRRSQQDICRR
jgi:hypothetical protein